MSEAAFEQEFPICGYILALSIFSVSEQFSGQTFTTSSLNLFFLDLLHSISKRFVTAINQTEQNLTIKRSKVEAECCLCGKNSQTS